MASTNPLATEQDLANYWRVLNGTESARATSLLSYASNYLRQIARNNDVDLDKKLEDAAANGDGLLAETVKMVVLGAVKRAMLTPSDMPPVDQWSQSASPYSESMRFTNPTSDLYFKNNELQLLGLASISGKSQFGLLRGVHG